MKKVGVLLTLGGIVFAAQIGGSQWAFIDIPAILFVFLIGFGILIASHGLGNVFNLVKVSITGAPSQTKLRTVAESGVTAFVAAGWIGTLIGVVQMLNALDDFEKIGAGMAVALLAAFYGYIVAYAICFPLSKSELVTDKE